MVGLSWSFPARSWCGASRMRHPSPPAVCGPPLRPVAIPPGTLPPMPLSRTEACTSLPVFSPIPENRWTRKRPCCAPWTRCPGRPCGFCGCLEIRKQNGSFPAWGQSRNTSCFPRICTPSGRIYGSRAVPCSAHSLPRVRSWMTTISAPSAPGYPLLCRT